MPSYTLHCEFCDAVYSHKQSIKDPLPVHCPACGEDTLKSVLYPPVVLDATPRTVGALADKNTGSGNSYWIQEERRKQHESRQEGLRQLQESMPDYEVLTEKDVAKPWWRKEEKVNTKLAELTPEKQANYIVSGDTRDR